MIANDLAYIAIKIIYCDAYNLGLNQYTIIHIDLRPAQ